MSRPLTPWRLAAFVSLEVPIAAFLVPIIVFVPPFYAGEMGLGLSLVGVLFGLTKLWDIVTDPLFATLSERFGPRQHSRRFWLMVSIPLMLLGVYKIFLPPASITGWYFTFWMLVLYSGWTLLVIAHITWGVELSNDYHERSRIASYRQGAALIGSLIITLIPVGIDQFTGASETLRIHAIGAFIMISLPIFAGLVIWSTNQSPPASHTIKSLSGPRWLDFLRIVRESRNMRILLLSNMAVLLAVGTTASTMLFYTESVLRLGNWSTLAIVPFLFSGLLFLPLWRSLARSVGKHKAYRISMIIQVALLSLFLVIPAENLVLALLAFILIGANQGTINFLPQAMIADVADVDASSSGTVRTAIFIGLLQSTSKISGALSVALMYMLLPLTGFDPSPNAENTASSLSGLRILITVAPSLCYLTGIYLMLGYDLSEEALSGSTRTTVTA